MLGFILAVVFIMWHKIKQLND